MKLNIDWHAIHVVIILGMLEDVADQEILEVDGMVEDLAAGR